MPSFHPDEVKPDPQSEQKKGDSFAHRQFLRETLSEREELRVTETIWAKTLNSQIERRTSLGEDLAVDVVIVGAGITGLTTALLLKKQGFEVAICEARQVASGASGGTSAHLTTAWDHGYDELIKDYGLEAAQNVCRSMHDAIDSIESIVEEHHLDCDFKRLPGYHYCEKEHQVKDLALELAASQRVGNIVVETADVPLPFSVRSAYRIENQARIHATKYVHGLAKVFEGLGGKIYEQSRVVGLKNLTPTNVATPGVAYKNAELQVRSEPSSKIHTIKANSVVIATHVPLGFSLLQATLPAYRSFVIAVKTSMLPHDALYWDAEDPYHYIRLVDGEDGPLVLIGGEDRKTAHGSETTSFRMLEDYAEHRFVYSKVVARWSAQFYEPAGHLPSIGPSLMSKDVYLATVFSGDGMVFGSTAARIISNQIAGRETIYDELYKPANFHFAGLKSFFADNLDVAKHFVADRIIHKDATQPLDLDAGEGCVVKGKTEHLAIYKTEAGVLRTFSAICPHMKCLVHWNSEQKSFDCPCHGSRFGVNGDVIEGPALKGLDPKSLCFNETATTARDLN